MSRYYFGNRCMIAIFLLVFVSAEAFPDLSENDGSKEKDYGALSALRNSVNNLCKAQGKDSLLKIIDEIRSRWTTIGKVGPGNPCANGPIITKAELESLSTNPDFSVEFRGSITAFISNTALFNLIECADLQSQSRACGYDDIVSIGDLNAMYTLIQSCPPQKFPFPIEP
jgi:hypothetical protein